MIGSGADGMIPRSMKYLIECIPGQYQFKAHFFEIYNESLIDLLKENSHTDSKRIAIYDGKVTNLETVEIKTASQFNEILRNVDSRRKKSETTRNSCSSRSHGVIQIEVKGKFVNNESKRVESNIMFLDLAGCENANDHLHNTNRGTTQTEMAKINKSVTNFQTVIESLKNGDLAPDFRSSKLTHLLKPCLTTNTKTSIITNISQEDKFLSTTQFH